LEVGVLLQSLLLVATLAIIGSALLTSTLVSAKAKFHSAIVETGRSAMTDATADFVAWTQSNVRDNGIDQLAVWAAKPQTSNRQPACGGATSGPIVNTSSDCKLFQTIEWNITGFTGAADELRSTAAASEATNLATAQNERRISATVNIAITDTTGSIVYSRQSRELTARIFHAFPYVAVTGERDASSETGSILDSEGDTAGYTIHQEQSGITMPAPAQGTPSYYTRTTVVTTMDCINTENNASSNAMNDDQDVMLSQLRPYGNIAWSYEVPCKPSHIINTSTAPPGFVPTQSNIYQNGATTDASWTKNNENRSTFAR
jgi:hypothetical protein